MYLAWWIFVVIGITFVLFCITEWKLLHYVKRLKKIIAHLEGRNQEERDEEKKESETGDAEGY